MRAATLDEADVVHMLAQGGEVVMRVRDASGAEVGHFEAHTEGIGTLVITHRRVGARSPRTGAVDAAALGGFQLRRLAQKAIGEGGQVDLEVRPRPGRGDP